MKYPNRDDDNEVEADVTLVDIACEVEAVTPMAWLLFDGARREWVPKSQCQRNSDGTFTLPEWLAREKGFI